MFNSNNSIGTAEPWDEGGEGGGEEEEEGGGEEEEEGGGEEEEGARQKYALAEVRIKNIRERKRKRSLPIKAISQIATSPNTQVT